MDVVWRALFYLDGLLHDLELQDMIFQRVMSQG